MNEWIMIGSMTLGGALFAIGGTGFKWARRFVLPISLGLFAYFAGFDLWRCAAMTATLIATLHLGYGESLPYWRKALTAVGFTAPTSFLGFNMWQIVTPAAFLAMFYFSNLRFTSRMFPWKLVEFQTGALIGMTVAQLISQIN